MKTNSLTVSSSQNREFVTITIRNPFTWENIAAFYRRMLPSFLAFEHATVQDALFITKGILFVVCFSAFIYFCFPFLLHVFQ